MNLSFSISTIRPFIHSSFYISLRIIFTSIRNLKFPKQICFKCQTIIFVIFIGMMEINAWRWRNCLSIVNAQLRYRFVQKVKKVIIPRNKCCDDSQYTRAHRSSLLKWQVKRDSVPDRNFYSTVNIWLPISLWHGNKQVLSFCFFQHFDCCFCIHRICFLLPVWILLGG